MSELYDAEQPRRHTTVLREEVTAMLSDGLEQPALLLDGTLGGGGHSRALLSRNASLCLLGIDQDEEALARCRVLNEEFPERVRLFHARFDAFPEALASLPAEFLARADAVGEDGAIRVHRMVLDLGISSLQLDDPARGFSFSQKGPLDMRMNQAEGPTAADVLNDRTVAQLAAVFRRGGVGADSMRLARAIEVNRPLRDTQQLAEICSSVLRRPKKGKMPTKSSHPATVAFQALRIEVNDELGALERFLQTAPRFLAPRGRLAIISFHSLEDRAAARAMRSWARPKPQPRALPQRGDLPTFGRLLTKEAIRPTQEEISDNPRSRSARLRVFERAADWKE